MSKELPYFRFVVSEWLNDDISFESFTTKGVFADICAYYWFRDCSLTKAMLKKRFSNALAELEVLFEVGIIKQKDGSEFIEILFLDQQFDQLSELRKARQDAGRKGGKQGLSKAKAKQKQKRSYKDKDKEKNIFIPPVFEDVKQYFIENGYTEQSALKAFNHYQLANWHDTGGKPVLAWKQKMHTVWFKEENKVEPNRIIPQFQHGPKE